MAEDAAPADFCIAVALGAAVCCPAAELFDCMLGLLATERADCIGFAASICVPVMLAAGLAVTRREGVLRATCPVVSDGAVLRRVEADAVASVEGASASEADA